MAVIDGGVESITWPIPVFAAAGARYWGEVQELRCCEHVQLVTSPRHAAVLLVAGPIPPDHHEALHRVHDQVPHPRGVVVWGDRPHPLDGDMSVVNRDDVADAVAAVYRRMSAGTAWRSPDTLPDHEPNEWRGVGPFGQGGEGMMGGTPYGRPMAMTGDDRDGLALDQLTIGFGPFLDALPGGVTVEAVLQGEVVQHAELAFRNGDPHPDPSDGGDDHPGWTSARASLQWLSHALHVHGLDAHAARAAGLATRVSRLNEPDGDPSGTVDRIDADFARLRRGLRWTGLWGSLRDVGVVDGRSNAQRWSSTLDEIAAGIAGRTTDPRDDHLTLAALADVIVGSTWTDALSTIVSVGPVDRCAEGRVAG